MKTFQVTWTLYNPNLKKAVDAPNHEPIQADTMEEAWKVLYDVDFPRPAGLEIIGVHLKQLGVDIREHIKD